MLGQVSLPMRGRLRKRLAIAKLRITENFTGAHAPSVRSASEAASERPGSEEDARLAAREHA
jgi:hypothetical protein